MLRRILEFNPGVGVTANYGERAPDWGRGSQGTYWCSYCHFWVGAADIAEELVGPICDNCWGAFPHNKPLKRIFLRRWLHKMRQERDNDIQAA